MVFKMERMGFDWRFAMRGKLFNFAYAMNFISQSAFSLVFPLGIFLALGYWLTNSVGAPKWVFAICIVIGVLSGVVSMFKYIIIASKHMPRAKEREEKNGK